MHPIVKDVLDKAGSQLGVMEHPRGSNDGPEVRTYLGATGLGSGNPWCAAFVSWCFGQVEAAQNTTIAFPKTASCDVILEFARRHDILFTEALDGDVFLVLADRSDATHTGFVGSIQNGKFTTVEGNSNSTGAREGNEVCSNARPFKTRYRFVRWGALLRPADLPANAQAPPLFYELFLSGTKIADMEVTGGIARMEADTWCQKLGVHVGWDGDNRCVLIDGRPVPATPLLKNGKAFLPIRVLAAFSGLNLQVDIAKRRVLVTRPHA